MTYGEMVMTHFILNLDICLSNLDRKNKVTLKSNQTILTYAELNTNIEIETTLTYVYVKLLLTFS